MSLRRKPCAALMRQLFFAPFAWLAAQLLLKGLDAASFQLEWELGWILLLALAIYRLLTLRGWCGGSTAVRHNHHGKMVLMQNPYI